MDENKNVDYDRTNIKIKTITIKYLNPIITNLST